MQAKAKLGRVVTIHRRADRLNRDLASPSTALPLGPARQQQDDIRLRVEDALREMERRIVDGLNASSRPTKRRNPRRVSTTPRETRLK
ncbi:MAG: hypothetical protein VYE68_11390 [Acidobacteriota bacterium]|nr:hypothetical protein [Acidobacteriota bacterium]